jgi:hypothetical protein
MPGERLLRILDRLAAPDHHKAGTTRLCELAADVTQLSGAGLMLMSGEVSRGSLCSSNKVSAELEDLQFTLGEGPCIDAFRLDRPVLESDLADPHATRWPAFTPAALRVGARAVFGFPVQVGVARLGSLNFYRDRPGALTDDQHADSLVMADVAARAVIAMQSEAPPGSVPPEFEAAGGLRFVVHQASGMVSVQLGVTVTEALVRMRAHAFGHDVSLEALARDIVSRRKRFERDGT